MRSKYFVTLCLALSGCSPQWKDSVQSIAGPPGHNPAIVGGHLVTEEELKASSVYRSVFRLLMKYENNKYRSCTSSLIHQRVLLTAAHCIYDKDRKFPLELSFEYRNESGESQLGKIEKVLVHPEYYKGDEQASLYGFDLALVLLKEPLPTFYRPIPVELSQSAAETSSDWLALGYGITGVETDALEVLRKVAVKKDASGSPDFLGANLPNSRQLLLDQSHGQGICSGDSGGPILSQVGETWKIIGVTEAVTIGAPQGPCKGKGLATAVYFHKAFIESGLQHLLDLKKTIDTNDRLFNSENFYEGLDRKFLIGSLHHLNILKIYNSNDPRGAPTSQPGLVGLLTDENRASCEAPHSFSERESVLNFFMTSATPNWSQTRLLWNFFVLGSSKMALENRTQEVPILYRFEKEERVALIIDLSLSSVGPPLPWLNSEAVIKLNMKFIDCRK